MRGFLILLVVAHHSVLAYFPKPPAVPITLLDQPRWWMAFPIVDSRHFIGFGPFVLFNDTFFMALLFLLSGLFVWKSLERKQPRVYLKDRLVRLGVPFVIVVAAGPLAYYPTYIQSRVKTGFWHEWLALGSWPAGPAWFLWALLVLDLLAVAIFTLAPSTFLALSSKLARQSSALVLCLGLIVITALTYVPMSLHVGPNAFWVRGPFYYQTSRTFFYVIYFLLGVALGAGPASHSGRSRDVAPLLRPDGSLARHWWQWTLGAPAGLAFLLAVNYLAHHIYYPVLFWRSAAAAAFTVSAALSSFACLAFFLHFVRQPRPWLDSLFACSFGIYLTHFFFVSYTQFGLLHLPLPALVKGVIVIFTASLLSWGLTALLRRSRIIARVL